MRLESAVGTGLDRYFTRLALFDLAAVKGS